MWVFLIQLAVTALLSIALAPKAEEPKPAALSDINVPTAEEGKAIPVVFGTVWIESPNVVWYGNLRTKAIKSKGGKK